METTAVHDIEKAIQKLNAIQNELGQCKLALQELKEEVKGVARVNICEVPPKLVEMAESLLFASWVYLLCFGMYVVYMCI